MRAAPGRGGDEPSPTPAPSPSAFDGLPAWALEVLRARGYRAPTPVQAAALPVLRAGHDARICSQTGSGKTLAFGLALLERIDAGARRVQALVLCPTRELAAQVVAELRALGRALPRLRVVQLCGGEPGAGQARALAQGADVVVGTPGRVRDHLDRGTLDPAAISTVVLDEADRMLEIGFAETLEAIRLALPSGSQVVLVSATFPAAVLALSAAWQPDPRVVAVDEAPPEALQAFAVRASGEGKLAAVTDLLRARPPASAVVFCNRKQTVGEVVRALRADGFAADGLQGDLDQRARDLAMAMFRNGTTRVLVATDVAARGLDVDAVEGVIHLDVPREAEGWIHRSGRTGRAGRAGWVVTMVEPADERALRVIEAHLGAPLLPLPAAAPAGPGAAAPRWATLVLGGGRREKLRRGDVLGALTGEAGGLAAASIGRIEVGEREVFVAVEAGVAAAAVRALGAGKVKGRRFRVDGPFGAGGG